MNPIAALAAEQEGSSIGPGSLGFWIVVFMLAALALLYRSMRRHIRKVDFDAEGTTDQERMRGHDPHGGRIDRQD